MASARARGLYTQPYCGCLLSERERYDRGRRGAGKGE
jgi:predicted adenine nucleotide alpha hydrolase (AANH) superfamily ATPase